MLKIDFTNEKNDKLYFYEFKDGSQIVEWAYIEPLAPDITYKTEEGDIKHWPKNELAEFILNLLTKKLKEKFDINIDKKSKSSQPKFGLKILGKEINVIHLLIANMGLISTLKFLGIKYIIGDKKAPGAHITIKLINKEKKEYLSIFANSIYEEYMINGLKDGLKLISPVDKKNINDPDLYNPFLQLKGNNYPQKLKELPDVYIDLTTKKILEMYNYPSDFLELIGKFMPKFLLNAKVNDFTNLETQRIRMAEAVSHSAYKMIQQSLGRIRNAVDQNKAFDIKLMIKPYEIVNNLLDSGMLQYTQTTNPLEELNLSAKITKTGIGNMKKDMVTLQKRDLNPSYYGVVAPSTTNEYGNVGNTQTLTNKTTIVDRFGTIKAKPFTDDINPFEILSASESLQPFFEYDKDFAERALVHLQHFKNLNKKK